jgi:adenylate cyclase class 2
MAHVNVEIKARCGRLQAVRGILRRLGAECRGTDHQVDTYFRVGRGRLKLREGRIENHLIHYERPNTAGPKRADVLLMDTEPGSPLKDLLAAAFGVLVVVDKRREIHYLDNVKFHLDVVEALGRFVEIEAQSPAGRRSQRELRAQCEHYLDVLRIDRGDLVAESYSDLLLARCGRSD